MRGIYMKRIALITTNKILAQSLDIAIQATPDLEFEFLMFLNSQQALLDSEIFQIDIALIDVMDSDIWEKETPLSFCQRLNKILPDCHFLLLVSQDNMMNRKMATEAKKNKLIDDFVFYDASLTYLLAKLTAFK